MGNKVKTKKGRERIPEINIGLLGHVDHGKTTLTEALSGRWTDTHSEEVKRGITIRLGYADVSIYKCEKCKSYSTSEKCPKCFKECKYVRTISLVDAPGHEMLMATVLSGAALMDGALLVIAANEPCPQPQTREHLMVLDILGIKNIVVVQTKLDLVTKEEAEKNYKEIKNFLKGTVAEKAPVIPVSAQKRVNIDILIETIEKIIPTPKRDLEKDPIFLIARSFDVNKPGISPKELKGGVIGGSLVQGKLTIDQEIEIKPGVKLKETWKSLKTNIVSMKQGLTSVKTATPGGLLGIMTDLDPSLAKSDKLSGNIASLVGKLPECLYTLVLKTHLLDRVVGMKNDMKVEELKTGETLMITAGTTKTVSVITSSRPGSIEIKLKLPLCINKGSRVAISKQIQQRWRLIGYGEVI